MDCDHDLIKFTHFPTEKNYGYQEEKPSTKEIDREAYESQKADLKKRRRACKNRLFYKPFLFKKFSIAPNEEATLN